MDGGMILVGSSYFFNKYDDFNTKDIDYAIIRECGNGYEWSKESHFGNMCIFEIVKRPPKEIINNILENGCPMQIGKFLVPEFNDAIGFTIEQIDLLKPAIEKMDSRHSYEKIIFDAYKKNKAFKLTNKQRQKAYKEYKITRQHNG